MECQQLQKAYKYTGLQTWNIVFALISFFKGKTESMQVWRGTKEEERRSEQNLQAEGTGGRKEEKLSLMKQPLAVSVKLRFGLL